MDSHQKKIMELVPQKDHKKILLIILWIVCCITLTAHFIKADKQSSLQNYNTDYFIENAIHQHEDCGLTTKNNKTFINYELLWAAINDNGEFEFYVIAYWQWYYVSNYYSIDAWRTRELYVKSMFSDNAYRNRRLREYWWTHEKISFLDEAEQYFWIKLDQKWEFDCKFCDKPRFFYEKIQNKEWEDRNLYGTKEISKQKFTFKSDGSLERIWISGASYYNRYFWNNDSTIIIKDNNNPNMIERFIIDEYKDYEMTAFSEYVQI